MEDLYDQMEALIKKLALKAVLSSYDYAKIKELAEKLGDN